MKKILLLSFIILIFGCASPGIQPKDWGGYYTNQVKPTMEDGTFWDSCNRLIAENKLEEARIQRNIQIAKVVSGINAFYHQYKTNLLLNKSTLDTGFDIAQIALSALGTYLTNGAVLQKLALASSILSGSKLAFDKNFLQNQGVVVLIEKMDILRTVQLEKIMAGKKMSYDLWTLDSALDDCAELFDKGTIIGALLSINNGSK